MSAKSFSLHIGINIVDHIHYQGWDGKLNGCENDALFYYQLAKKEGCQLSKLLATSDTSNQPTSKNVIDFLDHSIKELDTGDKLFITYSGHGGYMEDKNGDEDDYQDETWCLYDRQLIDDELFRRFARFRPGVQIFVISDSCHSGSIVKSAGVTNPAREEILSGTQTKPPLIEQINEESKSWVKRYASRQNLEKIFRANFNLYEPLTRLPVIKEADIKAGILQLGACQDNEFAMEDGTNGLFTKTVMKTFEKTGSIESYQELLMRTKRALTGIQRPNMLSYGANHELLQDSRPFGSTSDPAATRKFNLSGPELYLMITAGKDSVKLSALTGFNITDSLPDIDSDGGTIYYCSFKADEPGIYPWDHAYTQYRQLRENAFGVTAIEPRFMLSVANPGGGSSLTPGYLTKEQRLLGRDISRLYTGRIKVSRGLGKQPVKVEDMVFLYLLGLETVYVMSKEPLLSAHLMMTGTELLANLAEEQNYLGFVKLVKDSVFSSDTLTVHL